MEVCYEICLEEDRTNAMSVMTPATDFAACNARSSTHDSEKNNGKPIPICDHCKKPWRTKDQCWKLHIPSHPMSTSHTHATLPNLDPRPMILPTKYLGEEGGNIYSPVDEGNTQQTHMPQSLGLISVDGKNP